MSTLKPNKLDQVKSQLKEQEIPNKLFPKEIQETERHLFHVIIVESVPDPVKKKFNFKVHHKKYNEKSFQINKTQLTKLGYADAHIIHDPTLENLDKIIKPIDSNNEEFEKLKKQLEEAENKIKELSKEVPPPTPPTIKGDVNFDIEKAKGDDLKAFAKANNIDLKEVTKVDEIREVVKKWLDNERESAK